MRELQTDGTCPCPYGWYDDGPNEFCIECSFKCLDCDVNGCITCSGNRISPEEGCPCDVENGYYSTGVAECPQCSYICTTCTLFETCSECEDIRDINNGCACPTGYYDDGTAICKVCDYKCETCVDAESCTTCSSTLRGPVEDFCPCLAGYYEEGEECLPCNYACKTCVEADSCTSCL